MSLSRSHMSEDDFKKAWKEIEAGLRKLITAEGRVECSLFYSDVYKLCVCKPKAFQEPLYKHLEEFFRNHVRHLLKEVDAVDIGSLIASYNFHWIKYSNGVANINVIVKYLDMNWIDKRIADATTIIPGGAQSKAPKYIGHLAYDIWKQELFDNIKGKLVQRILEEFQQDRDGEIVKTSDLQGVILSLVALSNPPSNVKEKNQAQKSPLSIYQDEFETRLLESTSQYYSRESTLFLSQNDVASYLRKAETRLGEEDVRARKFLDSSSYDKLRMEVEKELISGHLKRISAECHEYIAQERLDDLGRMYTLLRRIPNGIDGMLNEFESFVTTTGRQTMSSLEDLKPLTYVDALLAIHGKYAKWVEEVFQKDASFVTALDKACRSIVNFNITLPDKTPAPKAPMLLAKCCDMLLKKGGTTRHVPEGEVLDKLGHLMTVFKYIDEKDVFQSHYSKMLSKRLIHGLSLSDEAEERMITLLKQACGFEYTNKLQRMFSDIALADEANRAFKDWLSGRGADTDIGFQIYVLQQAAWPVSAQQGVDFIAPAELEGCVSQFEQYYNTKYSGRRLTWLHHYSKADIKMNYCKKRYEVQASDYQMGVLLLYNTRDTLTTAEITQATALKGAELERVMESLLKHKMILQDGDTFKLNMDFKRDKLKFKIALTSSAAEKEQQKEAQATDNEVQEHRGIAVQAAIVRIMKARKTLGHTELMEEVLTQAQRYGKFTPSVATIKKQIEALIEKEYISRVEGRDKYQYLA